LLLLTDCFPDRPAFDMAVSAVLLEKVARGELPDTLRLQRHAPAVAFGRLDALAPGYPDALAAARARGLEPFERLAGGRAAVYHEGVITIGEALADPEANVHIARRYESTARTLAQALRAIGVDARVGEVPGEYCPGDHSVNARGRRKLSGTAQRVVRGGAYVGTVLVVNDSARIAGAVQELYAALGLDVDPATTGAVDDEVPGITLDQVEQALLAAYAQRDGELEPTQLDPRTLSAAEQAESRFLPNSDSRSGTNRR
jgi:octanoyl-[GcvH]:protein N-octanoyltransferase